MSYNSFNQSGNQSPNSQTSEWDKMESTAYDPENAERLAKTPRRKAEIANFLLTSEMPSETSNRLLSKNDIEEAYRTTMHSGDGLYAKEVKFMQQIDTPLGHNLENSQDVFSSLDRHEQKILGYLSGVGFDNYQQGRSSDLNAIVMQAPMPAVLAPRINELLVKLTEHNSPAKVQEYVDSFESFKQKVYGKRNEYDKAFDELYDDAENYYAEHGWALPLNGGRPEQIFAPSTKSQPLEHSPYHNKALDDQLAAEAKARVEKAAAERAQEVANKEKLNQHAAKIINSLITGKDVTEVGDSVTSAGARETVYGWINNGQLTSAHESQLLQTIAPPMHTKSGSFEKTFGDLSSSHERGILTFASGRGFNNRDQADVSDLQAVLNKYPTPVEFQAVEDGLLDSLRRANNSPEKIAEYQKDFAEFKRKFYGKRQEYHEAWQRLEQEAKASQAAEQRFLERMQSDSMNYQSPEVRAYVEAAKQQQGSTPTNYPADRRVIIKPRDPDTAKPEPKKGVFGKLFGRKK